MGAILTVAQLRAVSALRALCAGNEGLEAFLWSASAKESEDSDSLGGPTETKALMEVWDVDKHVCIQFGRLLQTAGFAKFVVGRHGKETRIAWEQPIGEIVQVIFERPESDELPDYTGIVESEHREEALTVVEAKSRLSKSLGVSESAIEIIVRY